jgi:uncharacterized protein YndB with AHSA1/START domain
MQPTSPLQPQPRHVIVRRDLPAPPAEVFILFTEGPQLARWFCDAADSDAQPGGEIHAVWADDEGGEDWERTGTWVAFEAPHLAVIAWQSAETAHVDPAGAEVGQPAAAPPADFLRVAIAPRTLDDGSVASTVTVISPLLAQSRIRPEVMQEAVQHGWQLAFAQLEAILSGQAE